MIKRKLFFLFFAALIITHCKGNQETQDSKNAIKGVSVEELMNLKKGEKLVAVMKTNLGDIEIELYPIEAPKTVKNFASLANSNFYNGIIFHRVIKDFMIQGGDPSGTGRGGASIYGGPFEDEFSADLRHDTPGVLSMANAGPNTNQSQFFITVVPTPWLDARHTVFGRVINGIDIVNKISTVSTDQMDKPLQDVVMKEVKVEKRTN